MNYILYKVLRYPALCIQRLPLGFHYGVGKIFTFVCRDVLRYRRDIIITNLSRSFPEKKYHEIKEICNDFYRNMGEIFAESMWFGGCKGRPEKVRRQRICEFEKNGYYEFKNTFENARGAVILSSHLGNWELLGGFPEFFYDIPDKDIVLREENVFVVYKQIGSDFWNRLMGENRTAIMSDTFSGYIESKNMLRKALENRDRKCVYVFPTDQYPYRNVASCDIPSFMAQPTRSMIGAAALASKLGMAVFECGLLRKGRGKYEFRLNKICDDASKMLPEEIMRKYYGILEEEIRLNPSNYLWTHKRWK